MLTNKCLLLSVLAMFFTIRVGAQNSLGDPVLYEDFGFGTNYTPVGPPLPDGYSTMKPGGSGRCPSPGNYLILNSSANCYDDTFSTINFDHSGTNPFGYLMMVNGDSIPVVYYTRKISGSKFCASTRYQFAVYLSNINTQVPRPADYVDANVHFTVKTSGGVILSDTYSTGPLTNGGFAPFHVDFVAPADGSDVVISLSNNALTGSIGNDFAMDDITVKPYGPVIDAGIGSITSGIISTTQCLNDGPAKYVFKTLVHNYLTPQYQWQSNINKKGWVNIPGQTKADLNLDKEFLNPAVGKYQYRVGVLSAPGVSINCQTFSEPFSIDVAKNPSFTLPAITSVCEGEILSIHADGGTYFHWTYPDGRTSEEHFLDVTTSATKSNEGVYTVLITRDNCTFETKTQVVVGKPLVATVDDTNPIVCEGDAVQLGANGGTTYKWTPSIGLDHDDVANPMASPTVTTEYNVVVSNGACEKQRTVKVTVIKKPKADAGKDKGIQEGDAVKLDGAIVAGNVANYYWTSSDNTSYLTSLTPIVNPTESTTYTLHLESSNNCGTVSDNVFVRVFKKLTIPTTITPNNDGLNDIWNIDKLITYPESVLAVYTRDGQEVFRTVGDAKHWNGIYQGRQLPAGVYYYVIDLKNNLPKKAGWVMLVR
jgi:gliding motility-associated-like protein